MADSPPPTDDKPWIPWVLVAGLVALAFANGHKNDASGAESDTAPVSTYAAMLSAEAQSPPDTAAEAPTDADSAEEAPRPIYDDSTYDRPQSGYDEATSSGDDEDESPHLSNSNHYVNSNGDLVHSPAYSEEGSIPAGATAQCADGTYSFSEHRQGTCSRHEGVSEWLR
jgi:hypothetical protein